MKRSGRRLLRHLSLAAGSVLLAACVYGSLPGPRRSQDRDHNRLFRVSMATAYVSLTLLAATLVTGPLNVLRRRPNPVSTDLRRDLGIWSALLGLGHVATGLMV